MLGNISKSKDCKIIHQNCLYPQPCKYWGSVDCSMTATLYDGIKCKASVGGQCKYSKGCLLFGTEDCIL